MWGGATWGCVWRVGLSAFALAAAAAATCLAKVGLVVGVSSANLLQRCTALRRAQGLVGYSACRVGWPRLQLLLWGSST